MTPVELKRELDFNSDFDNPVNVSKAKRFIQVARMILTGGLAEMSHGSERIRFDLSFIRTELDRAILFVASNDSTVSRPEAVFANMESFRD